MSSPNRNQARAQFGRQLDEARKLLKQQILKLRMDMIKYPDEGNTEPPEHAHPPCTARHNRANVTSSEWSAMESERNACTLCKANQQHYWYRDQWKKTRGERISKLRYLLREYQRVREHYWAAGGYTTMGADHSCWEKWKGFPNQS